MASPARATAPWIFWPIAALWDLLAFTLRLTGRVVGSLMALALLMIGSLLTLTVILAPIGIPVFIVGLLLLVRSVF